MSAEITFGLVLFGCLMGAVALGIYLRRVLPAHYLSADTKDAVKLAMGLVATMLGQLVRELRKRVQLAEEFGKLLSDFLERRNALAHDLGRIHEDPFTAEGRPVIEEYALRTAFEAHKGSFDERGNKVR
jgi:hypothetical protein